MDMRVSRIVSGGQTGADQGGLEAARALGITTGGWAPSGWLTEAGPAPELLQSFGLREHAKRSYPARTRANVREADGTVIFGTLSSPGSRLTWTECVRQQQPKFHVPFSPQDATALQARFRLWLRGAGIRTLNVAGNRESKAPGIQAFARRFLEATLKEAA